MAEHPIALDEERQPLFDDSPYADETPATDADQPAGDRSVAAAPPPPAPAKAPSRWRQRALMALVPLLILVIGGYVWATGGRSVSTDNAYVQQDKVSVSSEVGGKIVAVDVAENQLVKAGDVLFRIDPEPYRLAVAEADARIANAQVNLSTLSTSAAASTVDIGAAREDIRYAETIFARQQALMARGFTTRAEYDAARHAVQQARDKLAQAEADAREARARLATGAAVLGQNPEIAAGRVARAQAELNLKRTVVRAPIDGRVSQADRLQPGQMLVSGLPAVTIVADRRSWIEANFKETDLDKMRVGQPAEIRFDAYPDLRLKGHVASLGAGTGAEFSVLPAQNATGNWVKVTQRVPVRIAIDERAPRQLIAGMSADVSVDIRQH